MNPNFPFFLRVPSRMSYQSALPSSFSYWLRNRTEVVSLQDGWVNTWAVDWLWCPSRFLLTIFLASDMRYSYSSFILLVGGTYFSIYALFVASYFPKGFIPLWILPSSFSALAAGAFCVQFGVQGAWGVVRRLLIIHYFTTTNHSKWTQIPIHLAEMSPPAFRATFPGVAYQLGNVSYADPLLWVKFSYVIITRWSRQLRHKLKLVRYGFTPSIRSPKHKAMYSVSWWWKFEEDHRTERRNHYCTQLWSRMSPFLFQERRKDFEL